MAGVPISKSFDRLCMYISSSLQLSSLIVVEIDFDIIKLQINYGIHQSHANSTICSSSRSEYVLVYQLIYQMIG